MPLYAIQFSTFKSQVTVEQSVKIHSFSSQQISNQRERSTIPQGGG